LLKFCVPRLVTQG